MSARLSYTPFRFVVFLDYCAKLILLKKVGGGFIHRSNSNTLPSLKAQGTNENPKRTTARLVK
jgi:hypothetical protein